VDKDRVLMKEDYFDKELDCPRCDKKYKRVVEGQNMCSPCLNRMLAKAAKRAKISPEHRQILDKYLRNKKRKQK